MNYKHHMLILAVTGREVKSTDSLVIMEPRYTGLQDE